MKNNNQDQEVMTVKAVEENAPSTVQTESKFQFQTFDLTSEDLPDLDGFEESPLDLMSDYWTPEIEGESRRCYFDTIENSIVKDMTTKEEKELMSAYFLWKNPNSGNVERFRNASARLVGVLQDLNIQRGMPFVITYKGKVKNKTNAFESCAWSVKPLGQRK